MHACIPYKYLCLYTSLVEERPTQNAGLMESVFLLELLLCDMKAQQAGKEADVMVMQPERPD